MFDKLRKALARTDAAVPLPVPQIPTGHELVPVVTFRRDDAQMGALDGTTDSARPSLLPMPPLRSFDEEARRTFMPATAHARHMASVSGYISYGCELMTAWICGGDGLRLNLSPDYEELGWTAEEARTWSQSAEKLFAEWSNDPASCDARGQAKFGQLQSQAVKSYLVSGDIIAHLDYGPKRAAAWRSSLNLIDPLRLRVPPWTQQGVMLRDGIEFDMRGRPQAYWLRAASPNGQPERVPVFGPGNKVMVCHRYDGDPNAVRGVSPLASAIGGILQSMSAADAGVLAAHLAAAIVGTITSDLPTEAVSRQLGGDGSDYLARIMEHRVAWHEGLKEAKADVQIGHGARIVHLTSGERLELHGSKNGFRDYALILENGLREAARALGLSYEALTSDKSKASYASLKYAAVETRSIVERRRKLLIEPFCEFALVNVLEEAIATGRLKFKLTGRYRDMTPLDAFRELRRFACRAEWVGPAMPDADELKSVRAAQLRVQAGLSSLSDEIAATGKDPDAVLDKIAADREALKRRGIYLPQFEEGIQRSGSTSGGSR